MKRFLRKAFIGLAYLFAILFVLLIVFYAEENWRGARDWAACQKELAAKGESIDLHQLAPPGKPEDDLSKVPIFADVYQKDGAFKARIHKLKIDLGTRDYSNVPHAGRYSRGEPTDLVAWQKFYRSSPNANLRQELGAPAQDILRVLSRFDPELNEVDKAISNPNAYWPIHYERPFDTVLGGITSMIDIAKILQLRGVSYLENNEPDLAEKDYLFSFRLNRPLKKCGSIIGDLVMAGVRAIDDSILWEGFHRHAWNDAQLREMESALASDDILALSADDLRAERASLLANLKVTQDSHLVVPGNEEEAVVSLLTHLAPAGWWNEDRVTCSNVFQALIDGIHSSSGTLSASAFTQHDMSWFGKQGPNAKAGTGSFTYVPMTSMLFPPVEFTGPKTARAETYHRLARLACRLEEFRIAHGQYPDKLEELPDLPAHLNQEVLSEEPLHYQRKGDGYLLYSVGWDQKDDGGVLDAHNDDRKGDWAWPSP